MIDSVISGKSVPLDIQVSNQKAWNIIGHWTYHVHIFEMLILYTV